MEVTNLIGEAISEAVDSNLAGVAVKEKSLSATSGCFCREVRGQGEIRGTCARARMGV
jgi:hypothetical protein